MRKRIAAIIAALLLGFGGAVVVASPAAASWAQCSGAWFCVYTGEFGSGNFYAWDAGAFGGTCVSVNWPYNDNVKSVKNNSTSWLMVPYEHAGCIGPNPHVGVPYTGRQFYMKIVGPGTNYSMPSNQWGKVSSFRACTGIPISSCIG